MWMQVAGAPYNTGTTTINEPSNHHHHHHQVVNLDGGRKLRPLIPRPLSSTSSSSSSHSCSFDLYTAAAVEPSGLSNNKKNYKEESNGGGGCATSLSSSRWNPTAEQLRTLEELYRRGTRTPSTDQIQRITAQLRRFGNIEGKNVFYWFQNHKARERQKRRRHHLQSQAPNPNPVLPTKDLITPGKLGFDAQQEQQPRSHFAASQYSSSYADGATFKMRRLVAADQTTTRRETTTSEFLYEDQDSAPLLQLFPLTTQVNVGQQHHQHEEDEDEDASKETETDNIVHFFEFLPPKNN